MSITEKPRLRGVAIGRKLGLMAIGIALAIPGWAQTPPVKFDIPAQALDQSLRALARQSGAQIVFATELAEKKNAPAVHGSLTVQEALNRLLAGSGLTLKTTKDGAYTVVPSLARETTAKDSRLQEIEITATRPSLYASDGVNVGAFGTKKVEDLPFSIQSYTSELINTQDARTLMDVLKNDPSIQDATQAGAYETIRIRGFFVDWTNTIRRDGMSVAPYYEIPLENIEQVDVLKGPSGFLYGINSPGGTVNYVIKRPTRERFASIKTTLRDHGGYYASVDAGGPLNDGKFGYRFNLAGEKTGDFRSNGDVSRQFVSGAIDWSLSDDALLQLNFDYQDRKIAAQPAIGPQPNGILPPVSAINPRTLLGQPWLQYETKTYNIGADFRYRINQQWKLVSRMAQSYNARVAAFPDIYNVAANGDVLAGDIYLNPDQSFRVLSTDSYVSGDFDTGAVKHQLVAGFSSRNFKAIESGFTVLDQTVGNIYRPVYTPQPAGLTFPAKNQSKNYQPSVFVSDLVSLSQQWDIMLGLRHVHYKNDSRPASGVNTQQRASINAPSFALTFKPYQGISTYLSYAEGFEQPGPAGYDTNNAGENLPPLQTKQYEAGVKVNLSADLLLTAALFRLEKTLQYVNSEHFTVQGGSERHSGLEFSANGRVTRNLSVLAGMAFLHTEADNPGDPAVAGKQIADVPRFQANLFLDYRLPQINGLSVNGGAYYVGRRPLNAQNSSWMSGYTRFDTGLRYVTRLASYPATYSLTVQNLTDKRYWAAGDPSINGAWPGKPRTVYLSAQFDI